MESVLPERVETIRRLVRFGLTPARAQELADDAIFACLARDARPDDARAFYWRVVANLTNQYLRDEKPRLERTTSLTEDPMSEDPTPDEEAWIGELREEVEALLGTLSPAVAEVARRRLEGMKLAEIAGALGRSASTVRTQWSKARPALEELVERLRLGR